MVPSPCCWRVGPYAPKRPKNDGPLVRMLCEWETTSGQVKIPTPCSGSFFCSSVRFAECVLNDLVEA